MALDAAQEGGATEAVIEDNGDSKKRWRKFKHRVFNVRPCQLGTPVKKGLPEFTAGGGGGGRQIKCGSRLTDHTQVRCLDATSIRPAKGGPR